MRRPPTRTRGEAVSWAPQPQLRLGGACWASLRAGVMTTGRQAPGYKQRSWKSLMGPGPAQRGGRAWASHCSSPEPWTLPRLLRVSSAWVPLESEGRCPWSPGKQWAVATREESEAAQLGASGRKPRWARRSALGLNSSVSCESPGASHQPLTLMP